MSHPVAALGTALVTAAGCVWYLPAVADLRAGADRPDSRRTAAVACVTGWGSAGVLAVLLLVAETWWTPGAAAVTAAACTAAVRLRSATQRRREAREAVRLWAQLRHARPRAGVGPSRSVVAASVCAVVAVVGLLLVVGHGLSGRS
ncbi:hypothetical protein [Streptomyces olivochromogenes]|uniref:hypothetical protein n=1 Tax=Streptomyces olivochromogenes TaxID=1963 RepID=UPI001F2B6B77|nr:hypothetical protein [Streptomyces olivochromogenes]MCF3135966.1 hypothetical protein [Streptomyces olivochromogenes]